MGSSRWSASDWTSYASTASTKTVDAIYTSKTLDSSLDPNGVTIRESRDSIANPNSTPIIVGVDVTGSMGMIANVIAKDGLGTLFQEILDRKPIPDPHIMFMGIGDSYHDRFPLQVSQFEADSRIIEQLTKIYLEKGGGGNSFESYNLPWYFAAMHTASDSIEKRNKKGYLFTLGDEAPPVELLASHISKVFGDTVESSLSSKQLIAMAEKMYNVYHIIIKEGSGYRYDTEVISKWKDLLGQRAVPLDDHTKLAELIVSIVQLNEGSDKIDIIKSWSGNTSLVIKNAIKDLTTTSSKSTGVIKF